MARLSYNAQSGSVVGPGPLIQVAQADFTAGVGLLVTIPAGTTASYNVEVCGDDPAIGFVNWNLHDTLQNQNTSANSNIRYPVSGVRLNILSISSNAATIAPVVLNVVYNF